MRGINGEDQVLAVLTGVKELSQGKASLRKWYV